MSKLNIALTIAGTDPTGGAGIMAQRPRAHRGIW